MTLPVSVPPLAVDKEATDAVDDLRSPLNEMDSRLLFRGRMPEVDVEEAFPDTWRGTRDIEEVIVEGDARMRDRQS